MDWLTATLLAVVGIGWLALFLTADGVRPTLLSLLLNPDQIVAFWFADFQQPSGFLDRAPIVGVAVVLLLASHELGSWLLQVTKLAPEMTLLERTTLSIGAGLNLVSLYVLLVGLAGLLHSRWLIVAPLSLAAGATLIRAAIVVRKRFGRNSRSAMSEGEHRSFDAVTSIALGLAALFALAILLGAMLPPWDFDVREYHLQVPKEWWHEGRITFLPHNVYGNMPLGAEMQALAAMAFMPGEDGWWIGALAGKLTMACNAPLAAVLLFAAGRRWLSTAVGAWAALIYLANPWVVHTAITGLNEPAVAFYLLAGLYVLCLAPLRASSALLSGFFAGAAAACKYPAVLYAVLPLGAAIFALPDALGDAPRSAALWVRTFGRNLVPGPRWLIAASFAIGVLLGCGLWYAKNAALSGNPVYPLAYRLFDGATRTPEKNAQWERAHQVPRTASGDRYSFAQLRESLRQLFFSGRNSSPVLLPLLLVTAAVAITQRLRSSSPLPDAFDGNRSWFLPGAALFLFWITFVWWFATHRIDRFWLPALPLAALFAAQATEVVQGRAARRVVIGFLFAGIIYCGLAAVSPLPGDSRWFVSLSALRSDEKTPAGHSRLSTPQRWLNEHTPSGRSVLLVGDAAPFDLRPVAYYNTCFDDCLLANWSIGRSKRQRHEALTSRGIEYVYIDWSEIARYRSPGNYGYDPRWTRRLLQELLHQGILTPVVAISDDRQQMLPLDPTSPLPVDLRPAIYRVAEDQKP